MTKCMLFFIAVLIVALGAQPVQAEQPRLYVGESLPTSPGVGILDLHDECRSVFKGSFMCSTADVFHNGAFPGARPTTPNWINPSHVTESGNGFTVDAPSGTRIITEAFSGVLNCNVWADFGNLVGLVIIPSGTLTLRQCSQNSPVACCSSVLPSVAIELTEGQPAVPVLPVFVVQRPQSEPPTILDPGKP